MHRIAPTVYDGPFQATFALVLDERGGVSERYDLSGRYGKKNQKTETKLGGTGSTTTYRVVDENTIERVVTWADHSDIFTVKVAGKTCSLSFEQRKSGPTFKSFSTGLGVMATYTSMRLVDFELHDFRLTASARILADHRSALLADHDGRRVGVAGGERRHHRGVDHAQALDAAHAQP